MELKPPPPQTVSVGVRRDQVRLFERLIEAVGGLAQGDYEAAGFDIGYVMRPPDIPQGQYWGANPLDPALPIARIAFTAHKSLGYKRNILRR